MEEALIFPGKVEALPTYQLMGPSAKLTRRPEGLSNEEILKCYKGMVTLNEMDKLLYEINRQGLITFYMSSFGEEGIHFGSASALHPNDTVYAQYRETGVLMYRGFTVQNCVDQCFANKHDNNKGRQIPVHYSAKKFNVQSISSPLGTQIPQAAGAAYAFKLKGTPNVVACYFGEGAASEGDFHAGLNFAATLESPTIFLCRNNKWAISTPSRDQYRGDGIAARGVALGLHTIRVDGNDFFAVHDATREARRIAMDQGKPVLMELMTYRIGHHSTSDDWTKYRTENEVAAQKGFAPIERLKRWLVHETLLNETQNEQLISAAKVEVIAAIQSAEKEKYPHLDCLFTDVLDKMTQDVERQRSELYSVMKKYPDQYPTDRYSSEM
uniref:2-oxoisovalerate dehydrogenase subunit alpha n=1 Tax=Arcella intermedia TaxID=1963864 RepID=A0A6B2L6M7_9EUKA